MAQRSARRPNRYIPIVEEVCAQSGIPSALVRAIIAQESAGDPRVVRVGPRGVRYGLMQLRHHAALRAGFQGTADDLLDPAINIRCGVTYLKWLFREFPGHPALVVAAYHAGSGLLRGLVDRYGQSWEAVQPSVPDDTRKYVTAVMDRIEKLRAQEVR